MAKQYDLWFNWKTTNQCNLTCEYCCASFSRDFHKVSGIKKVGMILGEINKKKKTFLKSGLRNHWKAFTRLTFCRSGKAPALKIDELLATLDNLDKTCKILFSGGEPFLVRNIIEATQALTERHYVGFVTNLTLSARLRQLFDTVSPDRIVELTASLHIDELERRNLVNTFIDNHVVGQSKGFDITVEVVAYPAMYDKILHYKKLLADRGIALQVMPFIWKYNDLTYPGAYTEEEITTLELGRRQDDLEEQCFGRACNTGHNAFAVFPGGNIQRCFTVSERMGNIYEEIRRHDAPKPCPVKHCKCAMWAFDDMLYHKALESSDQLASADC
ncbi:MAG: hypothetical protein ACYSWU_02115 [Planctomycetota bacterium]|jgi:MoaA/NifB/PqqE/SkfB family radical SAM enzyme